MCDDLQAWPQLVALFMPKCVEAQWSSETPNERLSVCTPSSVKGLYGCWWWPLIHAFIAKGRARSCVEKMALLHIP